jgi:hypothetical protein
MAVTENESSHDAVENNEGFEPDLPGEVSYGLLVLLGMLIVFLVVVALGARGLLDSEAQAQAADKLGKHHSLLEADSTAEEMIGKNAYAKLGEDRYRIPVDRAMDVLVQDPSVLAPPPPPAQVEPGDESAPQ